jgi:hypothetical protein
MDHDEQIKPGDRVFRHRSDLFAIVVEVKGEEVPVKPEWPHDGSLLSWPLEDLRLAGVFE